MCPPFDSGRRHSTEGAKWRPLFCWRSHVDKSRDVSRGRKRSQLSSSLAAGLLALALLAACSSPEPPIAQVEPRENSFPNAQYAHHRDTAWVQIRWGQTLGQLLSDAGLPPNERARCVRAFESVQSVRSLRAGARVGIIRDDEMGVVGIVYRPTVWRTVGAVRTDSTWRAFEQELPVRVEVRHLCGTVETTIYQAFLDRGASPELVMMFSDIFQWDIDFFTEPKPGDEFRLIYELKYAESDTGAVRVGYGRILAAQYVLSGKPITAIYFENPEGKSGYYDERGRSFQKAFLRSPLNYRRITSYFTGARFHPIFKRVRPHYAVDFAAPEGTPVVAAGDGVVVKAGWSKGLGNYIRIRHTNPHYETLYGHLRAFARGIRKGVRVKQNQVIGYVGQTGIATGPHLHYAFYENGRPINPLRIRRVTGDPVPKRLLPKFLAVRDRMLAQLAAIRPRPAVLFVTSGWPFAPLPNALSLPDP